MNPKPMFHESRARWLEIAQNLTPSLPQTEKRPQRFVRDVPDTSAFQGWRIGQLEFSRATVGDGLGNRYQQPRRN